MPLLCQCLRRVLRVICVVAAICVAQLTTLVANEFGPPEPVTPPPPSQAGASPTTSSEVKPGDSAAGDWEEIGVDWELPPDEATPDSFVIEPSSMDNWQ